MTRTPTSATIEKMVRFLLVPRGQVSEATWQRMRDYERRLAYVGLWSCASKSLTLDGTKYERLLKEG